LDIPFFLFLASDSLAQEGLFEITQTIGLNVPNLLYPFIFVGLLFVLLPFTSVIPHFLAILVGVLRKLFFYIDSTGLLDSILLPSRALNALDGPYLPGSLPVQTGLPPLQRSQIIFGDDGIKTLKLGGVRFEQMQKIQHHSKKLNPKSHVTSIHLG
jgi:hypothetical protein